MKQVSTAELVKRANAALEEFSKLVQQHKSLKAEVEDRNRYMQRPSVQSKEKPNRHKGKHGRG